jgi:DNA recombination protein RmuC
MIFVLRMTFRNGGRPQNARTNGGINPLPAGSGFGYDDTMDGTHAAAALIALIAGVTIGWLAARAKSAAKLARSEAEAAVHASRAASLEARVASVDADLAVERDKVTALTGAIATAESQRSHLADRLESEAARVAGIQEEMKAQFENLASRLLEEKSTKFLDQNQQQLSSLLGPLRERLSEFRERMEVIHVAGEQSSAALGGQLKLLHELNRRMADEAGNLASALKGQSKTQGSWGELVLEKILEKSGLTKGVEYVTQEGLKDEDGSRRLPDVIIRLPENRQLVVDAKVSLKAYERWANSSDEGALASALREHILSVRRHVDELAAKDYPGLAELQTPDFVLMFVPVEPALQAALQHDPSLYGDAFSKNVVLVSSSTLLVALRAVESVWRRHKQTLNAQEIARQAGKLHDAFVSFVESLEEIGSRIDQAKAAYDQALGRLSTGRGNLVRRTAELEKLGARAEKQLPQEIIRMASDEVNDS